MARPEEPSAAGGTAATPETSRSFLRRLTAATGGGMFLDGWVYASIAAVIAGQTFISDLGVGELGQGMISASTLVGTLVGGLVIGYITDLAGRKPMFIIDLCIFLVAAVLMFTVNSLWVVVVLGLSMGIAIGGDYAIGSPLLGEFTPAKKRGNYLGILEILWNVGYVLAFLFGFLVLRTFPWAWHFVLASAAVPAAIILLLRHGLPESPRWLLSKGRKQEAQEILEQGGETRDAGEFASEQEEETRWRTLFARDYVGRTVFCCVFWVCIVLPYFGLTFFQAEILGTIGLANPIAAAVLGTVVALIGACIGWFLVDRVGRRPLLIVPMFATAMFLVVVALHKLLSLPTIITVVCFFGYLLFYGFMSILPGIYPIEVFPTAVRTSGEGVASAASRLGAAVGTFVLPISLAQFGLSMTLFGLAAVCLIGGITSAWLAPETAGRPLTDTGGRVGVGRRRAAPA